MKHLLKLADLTGDEIIKILDLADQMKYNLKNGIEDKVLEGKSLAMIFSKSSTRTRVSFEVGMGQLGGRALFLSWAAGAHGGGEPPAAEDEGPFAPDPAEAALALAGAWPDARLAVSAAGARDQAALAAAARARPGLHAVLDDRCPAGPEGWAAAARTALGALGTGFTPLATRARTPEDLAGRWARGRWRLGLLLQDHCENLARTGWTVREGDLEREVRELLGHGLERFTRTGGKGNA